jgi:uncharacterized membrane-anchored protein
VPTCFPLDPSVARAKPEGERLVARAGTLELTCLALVSSTTLGAMKWNDVLDDGIISAVICTVWGGLAMYGLLMCVAELTSAVPFSGGSEWTPIAAGF